MALMSCGAMQNGFATPSANQMNNLFDTKYGWESKSSQSLHQSLIGSSVVLGMAAGAYFGGTLMKSGRRRAIMLTSISGSIGVGLTMIENFYVLLLGRVIYGFTAGSQAGIVCRMIDEYVPATWQSACIGFFAASQNFASFVATCSAFILPKDGHTEAQKENETWRIIFAFPLLLYVILLLGFTFLIRHDTPKFYLMNG